MLIFHLLHRLKSQGEEGERDILNQQIQALQAKVSNIFCHFKTSEVCLRF